MNGNEDGKIVIGTELETSGVDKGIEEVTKKIDKLREKAEQPYKINNVTIRGGWNLSEDEQKYYDRLQTTLNNLYAQKYQMLNIDKETTEEIQKQSTIQENLTNKWENEVMTLANGVRVVKKDVEDVNEESKKFDLPNIKSSIDNIGNSVEKVTKKIVRWGLALFGIRSIYSFIRQSMSTLSQYNEQLATDVEYIRYALATTLQPIIETIIKLVYQLLGLINAVSKSLFGVDLFANATAKAFNKANKSATALQKTMFGFDKINKLNEDGSTGIAGSIAPKYDLSQDDLFAKWDLNKFIEKGKEIATSLARGINDFFRNTDWASLGKAIGDGIIGAINIVDTFIKETDWELIGQSIADFILNVDWLGIAGSIIELLFDGMIAAMDLMTGVTEKIVEKMEDPQFWENLIESGKKAIGKIGEGMEKVDVSLEKVWSKIISFFLRKLGIKDSDANKVGEKIGEGIHNGIDVMLDNLPFIGTFRKIIKFAKMAFGIHSPSKEFQDIGYQLMEGLKNGIKSGINGVIDTINIMIDKINGALAFRWNKIEIAGIKLLDAGSINVGRIPRIPRLAAGGIVNMPGRGVDYYGANIGERRPEGIVPLDNEASLRIIGETIAKNTRINADITLDLEGRILARVMKELYADRQFARNGG